MKTTKKLGRTIYSQFDGLSTVSAEVTPLGFNDVEINLYYDFSFSYDATNPTSIEHSANKVDMSFDMNFFCQVIEEVMKSLKPGTRVRVAGLNHTLWLKK